METNNPFDIELNDIDFGEVDPETGYVMEYKDPVDDVEETDEDYSKWDGEKDPEKVDVAQYNDDHVFIIDGEEVAASEFKAYKQNKAHVEEALPYITQTFEGLKELERVNALHKQRSMTPQDRNWAYYTGVLADPNSTAEQTVEAKQQLLALKPRIAELNNIWKENEALVAAAKAEAIEYRDRQTHQVLSAELGREWTNNKKNIEHYALSNGLSKDALDMEKNPLLMKMIIRSMKQEYSERQTNAKTTSAVKEAFSRAKQSRQSVVEEDSVTIKRREAYKKKATTGKGSGLDAAADAWDLIQR